MSSPRKVVVVGGGIVGASIAWHLAARPKSDDNLQVTVVAADVGGTATPDSFSWLNANRENPRFYYELRRRSLARWRVLAGDGTEEANTGGIVPGLSSLINWKGCIQWDEPPAALEAFLQEHKSWGYDVQRVDNKAIAEAEPALAAAALPPWGWGVLATEEGAVEARDAAAVLLKHAETELGLKVLAGTSVASLVVEDDGRVTGIVTASGTTIAADHVIVAAGLATKQLCATAGITIPVEGRAGLLAHSKPLPKRLLNGIVLSSGPHVRQTAEGRLLVGANFIGEGDAVADSPVDSQSYAESLMEQTRALFRPEDAALIALDHYTVGVRPDPKDGLPILGDVAGRPGLIVAVMHSGVTLSAIVGELQAEAVATGKPDAALAAYSLSRFAD